MWMKEIEERMAPNIHSAGADDDNEHSHEETNEDPLHRLYGRSVANFIRGSTMGTGATTASSQIYQEKRGNELEAPPMNTEHDTRVFAAMLADQRRMNEVIVNRREGQ